MRLLVTGGSGFIGRRVVDALSRRKDVDVTAASRRCLTDPAAGVTSIAVDLLAPGSPADLIATVKPTHLLHLAWNAEPGRFWTAANNVDWGAATLSLFSAFASTGGRKAVMAGTCAEYDWTGVGRLVETAKTSPATLYGAVKDATRRAVCAAGLQLGVPVAWGRVFWLYGPGEADGRLVSDVAQALAMGRTVRTSEGLQRRDFMHVDDVAGAFIAALESDLNGPFNIGSGRAVPVRTIVDILAKAAGRPELVQFGGQSSPPGEAPLLEADDSLLRQTIGFVPAIQLEEGLISTYGERVRNIAARI